MVFVAGATKKFIIGGSWNTPGAEAPEGAEVERKQGSESAAERAAWSFAGLLEWHIRSGTRPGPAAGKPWQWQEFAGAVGVTERAVRFWRRGDLAADDHYSSIERVLFGTDTTAHAVFRQELRAAYRRAKSGGTGPALDAASLSPLFHFDRCIGRAAQLEELIGALTGPGAAACLVLGGPGIGKTTLTRAAATSPAIADKFGARRWFVALDTARDAASLQTMIVEAVGLNPANTRFAQALARLAEQPGLVILDNLETPWESEPQAVESVLRQLAAVPGLGLVASLRGQMAPHAPRWTCQIRVAPLENDDARELFRDIAPNIKADDPNLGDFLRALGGIPLAIELVAHRAAPHETLAELWAEWQHLGAALAARPGIDPSRLNSLPHSIELSLQSRRLGADGKRLLRLLGQLPAGIAPEDRVALLGDSAATASEELRGIGLAFARGGRLDLLPPIRDHIRRFHPPEGEDAERWREHYLSLLRDRGAKIGMAEGSGAVARLAPEFPNFEAALQAQLPEGLPADTVWTVVGLNRLMMYTGLGSPSLIEALAAACQATGDVDGEAVCVGNLGHLARTRSNHEAARRAFERALPLFRRIGDILGEANCITNLGDIALHRSEHDSAREAFERALPLYRQVGNILGEANCIRSLGTIALAHSDHDAARQAYERALPLYRQIDNIRGEANCIQSLGDIAFARSDHEAARPAYEQALPLYRQIGDIHGEANCIRSLGDIALARSDHDAARQAYESALPHFRQVGAIQGEANCIRRLGDIALARSDHDTARRLYQQALALYERIPEPYSIGQTHLMLARVTTGAERAAHIAAARQAWLSIDRPDLVATLDEIER